MKKFNLIESIKKQSGDVQNLYENVTAAPVDTIELLEAADKYIGNIIAALKSGKNPFEAIPGSENVLAGLIMLQSDTNREAVNMPEKKFSIIAQKISQSDNIKKYVAKLAKNTVPSRIKRLKTMAADPDERMLLSKKLYRLQQQYGQVKHRVNREQEIRTVA